MRAELAPHIRAQMDALPLVLGKPLLVVDADEVLVHFVRHFEQFVAQRNWRLNITGYSLEGAMSRPLTGEIASVETTLSMIDAFFEAETLAQTEIPGAAAALADLSRDAQIIVLTNLPHAARASRVENLAALGIGYPLVTNTGGKGPLLAEMQHRVAAPMVFVDDSPHQIASARRHAPAVQALQFIGCSYARELIPSLDPGGPEHWSDVSTLARDHLHR